MDKCMTVAELIAALQEVPNQGALVWTEGCDCMGNAYRVKFENDEVLIERSN